ncbi:ribonuclease R [Desulfohalovibrio reitneri]|uniref:ribonuclease R n=1 Tax=Desulfohalovibrio reitneri TaxID=1307759 RepID=UPI0006914819|nr:ribonuclease R [Desulfohalovibrio reitneri]
MARRKKQGGKSRNNGQDANQPKQEQADKPAKGKDMPKGGAPKGKGGKPGGKPRGKGGKPGGKGGPSPKDVLGALRNAGRPLSLSDLLSALKLPKQQKGRLMDTLDQLQDEGKVIRTKRNVFGLMENMRMQTGTLEITRSGVGFVTPEDKRRRDIFINPKDFGDAWNGDRVAVVITREKGRKASPEGRIARVLERGQERMPCRVERPLGRGLYLCHPTDPRQPVRFMAPFEEEPPKGTIVTLAPDEQIEGELWRGEVLEVIGPEDDVAVQESLVKSNKGVPTKFPEAVVQEAEDLPAEPGEADKAGRKDLTDLPFVTIDGAKAKDFDDAVYVERKDKGYTLWVAIADVAHYVRPGSGLDQEARERANSYYFPQSVEPMFPEALSNGLCSLNPNTPRLSMVAEIEMSEGGKPRGSRFHQAVISSHARLTYQQVKRAVLDRDEEERLRLEPVLPMLELAEELARKINARRNARGSLDFDLPEPEILFNIYGETVDIRPKVRHFAHQIIEEFMIAANEAVAEFLTEKGAGLLYRIHPEPDQEKVRNLYKVLSKTDMVDKLPREIDPKGLQQLLHEAEDTDMEFMVSRLTLRTMMQAKYEPTNEGHFGLASECYCHFTSPIRRYADLQVHRALKRVLDLPGGQAMGHKKLKDLGAHLSAQERVGMEAEREILKRLTVLFLRDKEGQTFTGVINSLADFGFWVELNEVMAEGLVRLSTMTDDYYAFLPEQQMMLGERTGKQYKLGQKVTVTLAEVNISRLEINLTLA